MSAPCEASLTTDLPGGRYAGTPAGVLGSEPVDASRETLAPEYRLARILTGSGHNLATAESCTGGLIAHRITEVPGSSAYFERGLVVYSNRAKQDLLGVPEDLLRHHGAVSQQCVTAMLDGLFRHSAADLGAAATGIAGPGGGTDLKPVGTVWIAWGWRGAAQHECLHLGGDRSAVKRSAAAAVLERLAATAAEGR